MSSEWFGIYTFRKRDFYDENRPLSDRPRTFYTNSRDDKLASVSQTNISTFINAIPQLCVYCVLLSKSVGKFLTNVFCLAFEPEGTKIFTQ